MESPASSSGLVPLAEIATRFGLSWHRAYSRIISGAFGTPQQIAGRWFATREGVESYAAKEAAANPHAAQ